MDTLKVLKSMDIIKTEMKKYKEQKLSPILNKRNATNLGNKGFDSSFSLELCRRDFKT